MGDMGDLYRDLKDSKRQHKRERVEAQAPFMDWLRSIAVGGRFLPGGIRIEIRNANGIVDTFDYWPSSGKWCELRTRKYRHGERALRTRLNELRGFYD